MTVLPFAARRHTRSPEEPPHATAKVTGWFSSPSGRAGSFTGTYRLERLVTQFGITAAAGVFTGELVDADGRHLGMGSRRHTAAAVVTTEPTTYRIHLGPLDVNLLGLIVRVDELAVSLPRHLPTGPEAAGPPPSSSATTRRYTTGEG